MGLSKGEWLEVGKEMKSKWIGRETEYHMLPVGDDTATAPTAWTEPCLYVDIWPTGRVESFRFSIIAISQKEGQQKRVVSTGCVSWEILIWSGARWKVSKKRKQRWVRTSALCGTELNLGSWLFGSIFGEVHCVLFPVFGYAWAYFLDPAKHGLPTEPISLELM